MKRLLILVAYLMVTGCVSYHETRAPCDAYRDTCHDLRPINIQKVTYGS